MDINSQNLHNNIGKAVEDRISELPDSVLHYILSFLDIKHVARRWKHIWTSIPTLDLRFWEMYDPPELSEINEFMDFVDRTLLLHDASCIQKFSLSLYNDMNASRVHSWIENVTRHNVEELTLYLDMDQDELPLAIPVSLFSCASLTKLDLTASPSISFPNNIFLPKLKSLKLWRVQFGDGCWNEQPFSDFPVLEELFLQDCTWFGMRQFCIITPQLKVLNIRNEFDDGETGLEDCDLEIHSPSLVSLSYEGFVAKNYEVSSFKTIDEAVVEFFFFDHESRSPEKMSQEVSKFLQAFSHVSCLTLHAENDEVLWVANGFVSNPFTYHNLTTLALYQGVTTDKLIFALLRAAPNLRKLVFLEFDPFDDEIEYDETEDLFRHLQSVAFMDFLGEARELGWMKSILNNAKSLQTMTIAFSLLFSEEKNKEVVISELSNLPRASADVWLNFSKRCDGFINV